MELAGLSLGAVTPAKVAIVYDYQVAWTLEIQPQGNNFDYLGVVLSFYRAFRRLGLNVDVIPQKAPLAPYSVLAIPPLPILQDELVESLKGFGGQVLIAPRAGSKTVDFQIPPQLPPGRLQELIPITVLRVESLPEFAPFLVRWNSALYECHSWLEYVRTNLAPFIRLQNGQGAAVLPVPALRYQPTAECSSPPEMNSDDRHSIPSRSRPYPIYSSEPTQVRKR
jgi:beta-galactosidase